MTHMKRKRPVTQSPMCSEQQVKRIDPVWIPGRVPRHFWEDRQNHRNYLLWLGWKLGFRKVADWYRLQSDDFKANRGHSVLALHGSSAVHAVIDCFPEYDWHEWLFREVPRQFWQLPANRRRYLRWLGQQLGYRQPSDWHAIRVEDIMAHDGRTLLKIHASMRDLLQEFLPQLDWSSRGDTPTLTVKQILALADAHFAKHGTWPHNHSGPVAGTNLTWSGISERLRLGSCGLRGGSSISAILAQHRGMRPGHRPPPLTEEQILVWADAYYAAHGRWPTRDAGPIPGTQETWSRIVRALSGGIRGLPAGSSLARLLQRRRGVRNRSSPLPLSEQQIVAWARAFYKKTGRWPSYKENGLIPESTGETWGCVRNALRHGLRGLRGGSSLHKLLKANGLK
jgi:hypothetical protein